MVLGEFRACGTRLGYRAWVPPGAVGCLVQLHGIESHSEWFAPVAERLAARGLAVYALDRVGSGRSEGPRGDVERRQVWLDHLEGFLASVRARHPRGTLQLVGSCWGAKLAVYFALERPGVVDGLVLLSPALRVRIDLAVARKLRVAWAVVGDPTRRFPVPIEREELFTDDPRALLYIRRDPLRLREVTARFLYQMRRMDAANRRGIGRLRLPILALLAGRDEIVDVPAVLAMLRGVASERLRLEVLAGARHSLEFAAPECVAAEIATWNRGWRGRRATASPLAATVAPAPSAA